MKEFTRWLRLREYFYDEGNVDRDDGGTTIDPFHKKSNWEPPSNRDTALETYIKLSKEILRTPQYKVEKTS